jgi:hypothetical protein
MSIIVRNRSFPIAAGQVAAAAAGAPIANAFYAALSATFPEGERFFVQSVKRFSQGLAPKLAEDVQNFVRQEGYHAREHMAFNTAIGEAGFPIAALEARAQRQLSIVGARGPYNRLATTMALEHFTAVFAHRLLDNPAHLAFADGETRALWRWHAVEEIEHKCVAFDVFLAATSNWSPLRRYLCRTGAMLDAMVRLAIVVFGNTADVLKAQGAARPGWQMRFLGFALVQPGVVGEMTGALARFFLPGFHPRQCDDAAALAEARATLEPLTA